MTKKFSVMVIGVTMILDRIAEYLTMSAAEIYVVISVFIFASSSEMRMISTI